MRTQTTTHESVEMYLKTIAELAQNDSEPVAIADLAARLGVSAVSANEMMHRLKGDGLVEHVRYKGVLLTEQGRQTAHSVMRRQRLWECFLVEHLQMNWAGVYEQACRLEHATSSVLAESLATYLEHPSRCPHGNAIPTSDGQIAASTGVRLSAWPIGRKAIILSVQPTTTDVFAYLQARGLLPRQTVTVKAVGPLDGPLTLVVADAEVTIGRNVAHLLTVQPATE